MRALVVIALLGAVAIASALQTPPSRRARQVPTAGIGASQGGVGTAPIPSLPASPVGSGIPAAIGTPVATGGGGGVATDSSISGTIASQAGRK